MTPREELEALRRLAALEAKQRGPDLAKTNPGEYDPTSPEWQEKYGATSGMGGLQKFAAGYGKAIPDMAQGVGQRLGLVSQAAVDERKKLDAPLMRTGAGMVGNITGNVAALVPTVAIPGAATVPGAAAIGAIAGAAQPTATGESALSNSLTGAAFGGGGVAAGKVLGAAYRGGKAIIEPFTAQGPQRIAGRTLERFAENPIGNVTNAPTITGARQTLAEQTGDRGIATLQDALASTDPQLKNALLGRASENNAAACALVLRA